MSSSSHSPASEPTMGRSVAGEWDEEDIYDNYYRNSVNSRMSGRSRAASNAQSSLHKVPPVPDLEYRRPSLEVASIALAGSPTSEGELARDDHFQPPSPLPEKTKPLNIRKQRNSSTTPEPPSFPNNYNTPP